MPQSAFDSLVANQKSALDTLFRFSNISLNTTEKIARHHLSTARNALDAQLEHHQSALAAKGLNQLLSLGTSFAKPQVEQGASYYRGLYDIHASAQDDYIKLFEHGHEELNKSISSLLDWYSQSSGNSDLAVAAVKSAISAANSAFENANKTVRQVANIAEASVNAATSATVRAVDSVQSAPRKKAA